MHNTGMEAEPIDVEDYLDTMEAEIQQRSQIALEAVNVAIAEMKQKNKPEIDRFETYKEILLKWQKEYPTHSEMSVFERIRRLNLFFKMYKQAQEQG